MRYTRSTRPGTLTNALMPFVGLVLFLGTAQAQTFNVLYAFTGGMDGAYPSDGVTIDAGGNLYGTNYSGGAGYGTVYSLKHAGSSWVVFPLYSFSGGSDGANPWTRVNLGPNGSLYGSTFAGGIPGCAFQGRNGCGVIFNLKPHSHSVCTNIPCPWDESVLYSFTGGSDGWLPEGDLLFQSGNIIGTTQDGGVYNNCNGFTGCGVVFQLTPSGSSWTESVLWSFGNGTDGVIPLSGVVPDRSGNLYGAALAGGTYGYGGVYQLTPSLTESVIYSFSGAADGYFAGGGVILDQSGNIYGTTIEGGSGGGGSAYELTNGTWAYNLVYSFSGGPTGAYDKFTMDQAGNLYGATADNGAYGYGAVFKLTPSGGGTWTYTSLHDFTNGNDGAYPNASLVFDADGNIYGTANSGGANNYGVVFEISSLSH